MCCLLFKTLSLQLSSSSIMNGCPFFLPVFEQRYPQESHFHPPNKRRSPSLMLKSVQLSLFFLPPQIILCIWDSLHPPVYLLSPFHKKLFPNSFCFEERLKTIEISFLAFFSVWLLFSSLTITSISRCFCVSLFLTLLF